MSEAKAAEIQALKIQKRSGAARGRLEWIAKYRGRLDWFYLLRDHRNLAITESYGHDLPRH